VAGALASPRGCAQTMVTFFFAAKAMLAMLNSVVWCTGLDRSMCSEAVR
jgi:hypothetical protein